MAASHTGWNVLIGISTNGVIGDDIQYKNLPDAAFGAIEACLNSNANYGDARRNAAEVRVIGMAVKPSGEFVSLVRLRSGQAGALESALEATWARLRGGVPAKKKAPARKRRAKKVPAKKPASTG